MKYLTVALLVVAVLALVWIAAEYHYDNCVETARAARLSTKDQVAEIAGRGNPRIEGCSRLPF